MFQIDSNTASDVSDEAGWGSEEATQLILNNLLYITAVLSVNHARELSFLWNTLASSHPSNLPILLNYLFIMASLSPDTVLPHVSKTYSLLVFLTLSLEKTSSIKLFWIGAVLMTFPDKAYLLFFDGNSRN